ncbi:hypothetical protein OP864_11120 [Saprospira grandis]|nr:hypothetical protein [Saprospira grandis]WBM76299.1 hypothetical protein OP864_11120 [Saprospira grandis]
MRDGQQGRRRRQTQGFCSEAKKPAGPSRPASCDTARPARRAGQPQNNSSRNSTFLILKRFGKTTRKIGIK